MNDLEALREIFKDVRQHITIGVVTKIGLAKDNSVLRVQVQTLPSKMEHVAIMTFADVFDVTFPELGDLAILAYPDGELDEAHVVALVNSSEEKIPLFARTGHSVKSARVGKKLYLGSDTKVALGRPDVEPTQPLVLGTVLQTFLENFVDAILNATQIGMSAMGPVMLDPGIRAALVSYRNTYLAAASTNILSQIAFTERGV